MGAAKSNTQSSQYVGNEPDIEPFPMVRLDSRLEPSKEFKERAAAAKLEGKDLLPGPMDCNLEVFLVVDVIYPSRLVHSSKWDREVVAVSRVAAPSWEQIRKDADGMREARNKPEQPLIEVAK